MFEEKGKVTVRTTPAYPCSWAQRVRSWLNGPLKDHKSWIMISRSSQGEQLFPAKLNLAQGAAKLSKESFQMLHTCRRILYLPACVWVYIVYHSWRIPRLSWSWCRVTGGRQQEFTMTLVSWLQIYCTCIWPPCPDPSPPGNWLRAGARGYLTTLCCCCYPSSSCSSSNCASFCLQQVHLNIQFQCACCAHSQSPFQASLPSLLLLRLLLLKALFTYIFSGFLFVFF